MRKAVLVLWLALPALAKPPLPPPPPLVPEPVPGEPAPFNPDQTRAAIPKPPIQLPLPQPEDQNAPRLPLRPEEAVRLAWRLQPDIRTAQGQLQQAEGTTIQQRAALLPQIGGTSQFSHISGTSAGSQSAALGLNPTNRTTDTWSNSLGINWLLFDFGHTRDLVRAADLRRQAAAAALLRSENDVSLTVKERYYAVLQQQRLVQVGEDDLKNRQEQLRLARALYQAGNMSPGDVVRSQTTVSNSVFALNNARRNLELARLDLAQSLGISPRSGLELVDFDDPDVPLRDMNELSKLAFSQRPDMLVAQRNVEAAKASYDAARTLNYPALSTFAGITYQGRANGVQYPTFNLQMQIDFQVWDGGQQAGATINAQGGIEVAQADYTRTQLLVERDVSGVVAQLLTAERNLEAATAAVDSAREGVRIASGRYRAALGTLTDVFDAQNAIVSARTNYVNSLNELNLSRARLRHALAAPFEHGYFSQPAPPTP